MSYEEYFSVYFQQPLIANSLCCCLSTRTFYPTSWHFKEAYKTQQVIPWDGTKKSLNTQFKRTRARKGCQAGKTQILHLCAFTALAVAGLVRG